MQMSPLKSYGCSICGEQAPTTCRADGKFEERMAWLLSHRKKHHPKAHRESVKKAVRTRNR